MKTEDSLSLKLSLRARLRLSKTFVDTQSISSRKRLHLSKLCKRSSHIKKIISKITYSTQKVKKTQAKRILKRINKTRSRTKKDLNCHPFRQLVSSNVDSRTFKKFLKEAYEGAVYSTKHLQSIQLKDDIKKTVQIQVDNNQKYLVLDLDETLIHSVSKDEICQVTISDEGGCAIRMNIRPYVREFLENMSKFYHIYVYTASTKSYAQPILNYLDPTSNWIKGLLCRPSCVVTSQGCYVKDLRLFSPESLNNVVIIDNYVHSFGLQMQNGIVILPFEDNELDQQLKYVQSMLMTLKDASDVRPFLSNKLKLRKLGEMKKRDLNL